MKKELTKSISIILFAVLVSFALSHPKTEAIISQFTATLIGGKTEGVQYVCCNGIRVAFDSIQMENPHILDGEAIITPGISELYKHGNEMTQGYYAVGSLLPGMVCLDPAEDCAPSGTYPQVLTVGTGGLPAGPGI
jgi:hypothetical protein